MKALSPKTLLRIEGLAFFLASTGLYFRLDGPPWLYLILLLSPDIGILGYASKDPKLGSRIYNLFHTYTFPVTLACFGFSRGVEGALWVGLIWGAHIGMDRLFGYGLKFKTRFKDTHLQRLG